MNVRILEGDGTGVVVIFSPPAWYKAATHSGAQNESVCLTLRDDPLRYLYSWAVYYKFFADKQEAVAYLERCGLKEHQR